MRKFIGYIIMLLVIAASVFTTMHPENADASLVNNILMFYAWVCLILGVVSIIGLSSDTLFNKDDKLSRQIKNVNLFDKVFGVVTEVVLIVALLSVGSIFTAVLVAIKEFLELATLKYRQDKLKELNK